jgi:hypothetical protein
MGLNVVPVAQMPWLAHALVVLALGTGTGLIAARSLTAGLRCALIRTAAAPVRLVLVALAFSAHAIHHGNPHGVLRRTAPTYARSLDVLVLVK